MSDDARITDHASLPGPEHWNWRCLRCDHPVAEHAGLIGRILARWKKARA